MDRDGIRRRRIARLDHPLARRLPPDDGHSHRPPDRRGARRTRTSAASCIAISRARTSSAIATGRPKILDFGIARRLPQGIARRSTRIRDRVAAASAIEGTLPYMAPEVIRGDPPGRALGLCGRSASFSTRCSPGPCRSHGRNSLDLAAAIVQGSVQLPERVPPPLARIVARLLSREPGRRVMRTAAETAAALDALGDSVDAATRGRRTSRSRYAAAGLVLVAVLLRPRRGGGGCSDATLQLDRAASDLDRRDAASRAKLLSGRVDARLRGAGRRRVSSRSGCRRSSHRRAASRSPAARSMRAVRGGSPKTNQILFALAGQGLWTVSPTGGTPTRLIERGTQSQRLSRWQPHRLRGSAAALDGRRRWVRCPSGQRGSSRRCYGLPMMPALSPDGSDHRVLSAPSSDRTATSGRFPRPAGHRGD